MSLFLFNLTTQNIVTNVNEEIGQSIRVAAFEQRGWVERTDQFMELLSKVPEVRSGDEKSCSNFLASILKLYPRYTNIGVINANGDLFCSAFPFEGQLSAKGYRWYEDSLRSKTFSVGDYQIGELPKKAILAFGYPILDAEGNVKYVLSADLDLNWIEDLINKINLPSGSTIKVIDQNGVVLARIPQEFIGEKVPEPDLLEKVLAEKTGTFTTIGVDKVKRIYAFTSLDSAFIIIGTPYSYVYAQALKISIPYLIVFIMSALISMGIIWKIWKNQNTPEENVIQS